MSKRKPRRRNPEATQFAREQRATSNDFARLVWQMVRNRGCCGEKFRREYPIAPYTVDFCCVALKLILEVDGKHHFTNTGKEYDSRRDAYLQKQGYQILRIPGHDVIEEPAVVRDRIVGAITQRRND